MSEDMSWATVERSDEPLHSTTLNGSEDVLEVPVPTDDVIGRIGAGSRRETPQFHTEPTPSFEPSETQESPQQRGEPGSFVTCEICGRDRIRIRKDGLLATHKCVPKATRGNRFDELPSRTSVAPSKVRKFGIAIIGYAVEEGAAAVLARPFGTDPDDVPSDLPDANAMIGPPLDIIWPSIPKAAQQFLEKCADNADLIDCAIMWIEWSRTLSKWTREQRSFQQRLMNERNVSYATQPQGPFDGFAAVVPFQPTNE